MPFTLDETPESRQESFNPPVYTLIYNAVGEHDNDVVVANSLAGTPLTIFRTEGTLTRQGMRVDPVGWAHYLVTVSYGLPQSDPLSLPVGTVHFSFDTSGATVNIKVGKEHIASYPPIAGKENVHEGAINVTEEGGELRVEGVDIVIPALKLTYTFKHPLGAVTEAFAKTLAAVTGATNLFPFRGFDAGELLFMGASGADGTDVEMSIAYNFLASQNLTGRTMGDITDIVKGGHHYLWIEFKDAVVGGSPARQPRRVNIERIYDPVSFANVFGWS